MAAGARYLDPEVADHAQERLRAFEHRQRIWVLHCGDPLPPSDPELRWFRWFLVSAVLGALTAAAGPLARLAAGG